MIDRFRDQLEPLRRLWARRALRDPIAVGGPLLTVVFWGILVLFLYALWLSPVLPFGDYNYHLALAGILRRMASASTPEATLYSANIISYNAGFHVAVALLSFVMPTHYAGVVVFSGCWVGLGLAVIALLRALDQPTERAFIVFPIFLSVPFAWGFTNYCLGTVISLYCVARVIRRPRTNVSLGYDIVTAIIAILALWAQLFPAAIMWMLVGITLLVRTWTDRSLTPTSFLRMIREGLAFVPSLALAAGIYLHQQKYASRYVDQYNDKYANDKAKSFFGVGCDYYPDMSDIARLKQAAVVLCVVAIFRALPRRYPYPTLRVWLFAAVFCLYLMMPEYWIQIAVLFQRLPMIVVIFFALVLPRATSLAEKSGAALLAVIGLRCALAFLAVRREQLPDLKDLEHVVDESPARRRVAVHAPYTQLKGQTHAWAGHLGPYYVAAKKGVESAINYAGIPSNPVHYRGANPPVAPDAVAQGVASYSPSAPYAKRFDLVLVRMPTLDVNPAASLWGARVDQVELVSHHGHWWMFDVRRYFEAPTP